MKKKKLLINILVIIIVLLLIRACAYRLLFIDVTPLPAIHSASYNGDNTKLKFLLLFNSVNSNKYDNETPLIWAIRGNQLDTVKLLLEKGADIEYNSSRYETVPHRPLFYAAREGNIDIIKYLINSGASFEKSPDIINIAISCGYIDVVNELIKLGVDINYKNNWKETPILVASRAYYLSQYISGKPKKNDQYIDIIQLLINNSANVLSVNEDGNSTLIYASMLGNLEAVKLFIDMGVPINHQNNENKSALYYAKEKNKSEIVDYLTIIGAIE